MSDQATTSLPALAVMHRRYEASLAEQGAIERALTAARNAESDDEHLIERGSCAACREADALRLAILYQVPTSAAEAAILQFHISNAFDLMASCEDQPTAEKEALSTAIDTLFGYMAGTQSADLPSFGRSFAREARRVASQRRHRTGQEA